MREKINEWEEQENQRAVQRALYNHMSASKLHGDFMDQPPVNADVVNLLRQYDSIDD